MEKRDKRRIHKRVEVFFTYKGARVRGVTSNLSSTGLFIRTKKGHPPGTVLDIEFSISPKETLYLRGRVVRTVKTPLQDIKNGMGVDLLNPDPKYVAFVRSLF